MADHDFTALHTISAQAALNRIFTFRNQIISEGYDSLFSHGEVNEKRRRSDHMALCLMIDDLCEVIVGEDQ